MDRRRFLASGAASVALAPFARATAQTPAAFWDALAAPGVHVIMRHALAPGGGDPADFDIDDPGTQRRLSDAGRDQARAIGAAFRAAGVAFDAVYASQWDRCRETAALLDLGAPQDLPALNSFFRDRAAAPARTAALTEHLRAAPAGARLMLVTHFVNIGAFLSRTPRSGEAIAFRLPAVGAPRPLATLVIPAA